MQNSQYDKVKKYRKNRIGLITTRNIIILTIIVSVFISVGYSYWNTTLHISGAVSLINGAFTTYEITFNSNGGTGTMGNQQFIPGETKGISQNTFTRSGYVFRGWATSNNATTADYSDEEVISLNSNIVLYAVWKQTFTVTLYRNQAGNDKTTTTVTVVEDEEYIFTTPPWTRTGYTLSGWATKKNGSAIYDGDRINTTSNPITANTSLYAKWTSI